MIIIYNSRNFSFVLDFGIFSLSARIYNSRNFSFALDNQAREVRVTIYNSRNFSFVLDRQSTNKSNTSTIVEILILY